MKGKIITRILSFVLAATLIIPNTAYASDYAETQAQTENLSETELSETFFEITPFTESETVADEANAETAMIEETELNTNNYSSSQKSSVEVSDMALVGDFYY